MGRILGKQRGDPIWANIMGKGAKHFKNYEKG